MSIVLGNPTLFRSGLDRPIPLRMRGDLAVRSALVKEGMRFIIKDPLAFQHFQYLHEEYFLLTCLDGNASRNEVQSRFEKHFPGAKLSLPHFEKLLTQFFYQGLVVTTRGGAGEKLHRRWEESNRPTLGKFWSRLLSYRVRGFRMGRLLDRIEDATSWLLSPIPIAIASLCIVMTIVFVAWNFAGIVLRLPSWSDFLTARSLMLAALSIGCTKVVHELAHAMVCRKLGAECNEIGLLFLLFVPCLYCDVSDAWMLASRWKRAAVAAAGMAAELMIATFAFWYWWFSYPGFANELALQIAIVCSINTLLINGQPLLRYDGYFVLSDWVDIPNLWSASRRQWRQLTQRLFLKRRYWGRDSIPVRRSFLLVYGASSILYQWMVMMALFWIAYHFLDQHRWNSLFWTLFVMVGFLAIVGTTSRVAKKMQNPLFWKQVSWGRTWATTSAIAIGMVLLSFVPIPWQTSSYGVLRPDEPHALVALTDGILVQCTRVGERVEVGDVVALLENRSLELQILQKRNELEQAKVRLESLRVKRNTDSSVSKVLMSSEQTVLGLEQELGLLLKNEQLLSLRSEWSGWCVQPRRSLIESDEQDASPNPLLVDRNLGCYVGRGTVVAQIEGEQRFCFQAYLEESSVAGIQPDQKAKILLRRNSSQALHGKVRRISAEPVDALPPALGMEPSMKILALDKTGRTARQLYMVEVELEESLPFALNDGFGKVWIATPSKSLAGYLYRSLAANLKW